MLPITDSFEYDYRGCDLRYGRGSVADLGTYLRERHHENALIVCGSNVGANDALMQPIRDGLGDRLASVYDGTTPEKQAESAFDVVQTMRDEDAEVLVGVGGGSSLDVARQASVFAPDGRSLSDLREEAREGTIRPPTPDDDRPPVVVIPTTFAGADVSDSGSIEVFSAEESPTGQPVSVNGYEMPIANFADPELFETTPNGVLAGSAMNGFNKGIETLYSRGASPVSDATAIHGLRVLGSSLPRLFTDSPNASAMDRAVAGAILVQLNRKLSIIHAFGHGLARRYPLQQGVAHAVLTPHVLRYLLDEVDARRELLGAALGVDDTSTAELDVAVLDAVTEIRDSLGLPTRLRSLPVTDESDIPAIATFVLGDGPMASAPTELDPTQDEIEAVLRAAW